jgi:Protein of unknown function (DUF2510)
MTTQIPPAGWYADPSGKPGQMYWDGQRWQQAIPTTPPAAAPTSRDKVQPNPGGQGGYNPPPSYGQPQGGYGQPAAPPGYRGQLVDPGGSGGVFDLRTIVPGGLMAVVGGLLYFVVSFCPWYTDNADLGFETFRETANAWDRGSGAWSAIIFLLVALAFVVKALKVVPTKLQLEMISLGLVVVGDIFFLVAFLDVPGDVSRGWGLWIDLIVVLVINAGAVLQFIKVGGLVSAQRGLSNMQRRG